MLSHLSPGLTNASTGVANAALDCIPMVVIAGDVPSYYYGKHPHQEVNLHADASQYEIYRPFVKSALAGRYAGTAARTPCEGLPVGRKQPAWPGEAQSALMDFFSAQIEIALWDRAASGVRSLTAPGLDDDTACEIITRLMSATAPIIHVGGGIALAKAFDGELRSFY